MDLALCRNKVGTMKSSKMYWYSEALRIPFTGTKDPSPTPEKQPHTIIPPPPNFTLGTMQSGKYRYPGNCQTQTHPSDCQTEKRDSSLQRTHHHCTRVQDTHTHTHTVSWIHGRCLKFVQLSEVSLCVFGGQQQAWVCDIRVNLGHFGGHCLFWSASVTHGWL